MIAKDNAKRLPIKANLFTHIFDLFFKIIFKHLFIVDYISFLLIETETLGTVISILNLYSAHQKNSVIHVESFNFNYLFRQKT